MRWRRARSLTCRWAGESLIFQNYLTQTSVTMEPVALTILHVFADWRTLAEVSETLDCDAASLKVAVKTLEQFDLLLTEDDLRVTDDEKLAREWAHWGPEGVSFHFGTKNCRYVPTTSEVRQRIVDAGPPPELFKSYREADRILLPRLPAALDARFGDVLYGRRTHRSFTTDPVPRETLSTLLASVFGPKDFIDAAEFGSLMLRTSPSGGARQEQEAYLAVFNVRDIDSGLYHYNVREHSLELLRGEVSAAEVAKLCQDQSGVAEAAFVVFLTAVVYRMSSKYRGSRTYRVMLMNAGHYGQSFALTATALGLGPFQTAAFDDDMVEDFLGLDGITETALYVLSAGVPVVDDGGRTPLPPSTGRASGVPTGQTMTGAGAGLGARFRRLQAGYLVTNLADGMVMTALPLLAITFTTDPLLVAGLMVTWYLPGLLLGLPAGAVVDRLSPADKARAMLLANLVRGTAVIAVVTAVAAGHRGIELLYLATVVVMSCEMVYDAAGRALLPELVPRAALGKANSRLEGGRVTAEDFAGGPLASVLFVAAATLPLATNAAVYVLAGLALLPLCIVRSPRSPGLVVCERAKPLMADVTDGLRFVWHDQVQRGLALSAAAATGAVGILNAVLVLLVTQAMSVPMALYGVFTAGIAAGALTGAVVVGALTDRLGQAGTLISGHVGLAAVLTGLALTPGAHLGLLCLIVMGVCLTVCSVTAMSIVQAVTPQALLGRTIGIRRMLARATGPVGALLGGLLGRIDLGLAPGAAAVVVALTVLWSAGSFRAAGRAAEVPASA
jgi:SagB-type dehydrogenase family enzyme